MNTCPEAVSMGVVKTRRFAPTFETISRFAPTSVGMKVALVAPRLVTLAEDADDRMEKVSNFPFAKTNFALKGVSHLSEYIAPTLLKLKFIVGRGV